MNRNRRDFLCGGMAALGATLLLPATAIATPSDGSAVPELFDADLPEDAKATKDNIQGPFFRDKAPFRAKITPPLEAGTVLLITGRVWSPHTRKPLPDAIIDIWQANVAGRYDNDDRGNPPAADVFTNRARLRCDEEGRYEFETIHPGAYKDGNMWRPPHIHYRVQAPRRVTAGGRQLTTTLVTQLYFEGDRHQEKDPFIKPELIIKLIKAEERRSRVRNRRFRHRARLMKTHIPMAG